MKKGDVVMEGEDTIQWEILKDVTKLLDVIHGSSEHISSRYEIVLLPGDEIMEYVIDKNIGYQDFHENMTYPYMLLGHFDQRRKGETDSQIQEKIEKIAETHVTPILCIVPLDANLSIEDCILNQLKVLENFPAKKDIIIAYEPGNAIGTGNTETLEHIRDVYQLIQWKTTTLNKRIIYGWSVNSENIADILTITDGVIIGKASQSEDWLRQLFAALKPSFF